MEFSPENPIVKLCLQGMNVEAQGKVEEASEIFLQALNTASNDFDAFLANYFFARTQKDPQKKLMHLQESIKLAKKINDASVNAALPGLYNAIASCQEELGAHSEAQECKELAASYQNAPDDQGPFYHGTRADLKIGDFLNPGVLSNYEAKLTMNHIYFTALANGAGLAAALAKGEGRERVYLVEPTGAFESDPNVTDKKFPGNPTRSYRSARPLKIIGELNDWVKQTPEAIKMWKDKLANNTGEIIN